MNVDVCVMGGGPAGAAAARNLARLGESVVVVQKGSFHRPHIGESLTPGVLPLFDALGVKQRIEKEGFLRPQRILLHWPPVHGYRALGNEPGFQVDRITLDTVLLKAAQEAGARVFENARVIEHEHRPGGGWNCVVRVEGKASSRIQCQFLVDATGREGICRTRRKRQGIGTLAVSACWEGSSIPGSETRVEAGSEEWFWGAPLRDGTVNATVFVDNSRYRALTRRMKSVQAVYLHLLEGSELLNPRFLGRRVTAARVADATSYASVDPVFQDGLRVGEAAYSLDPLSSQGVQAALSSGLRASAVLHTLLRKPERRDSAESFYRERQRDSVDFHSRTAAKHYAHVAVENGATFWRERAAETGQIRDAPQMTIKELPGESRIQISRELRFVSTPCLVGDFIVAGKGLVHPNLSAPVAFLSGIAVAPLLNCLTGPRTMSETLQIWSRTIAEGSAIRILGWFWERGVIVSAYRESKGDRMLSESIPA